MKSIPRHILFIPRDQNALPLEGKWGERPLRALVGEKPSLDPDGEALVIMWEGDIIKSSLDWMYRQLWSSYIVDDCDENTEDIEDLFQSDAVQNMGSTRLFYGG